MTRLYRPVGLYELAPIAQVGFLAFPRRLPGQPIVYPVLKHPHAEWIASRWSHPTAAAASLNS